MLLTKTCCSVLIFCDPLPCRCRRTINGQDEPEFEQVESKNSNLSPCLIALVQTSGFWLMNRPGPHRAASMVVRSFHSGVFVVRVQSAQSCLAKSALCRASSTSIRNRTSKTSLRSRHMCSGAMFFRPELQSHRFQNVRRLGKRSQAFLKPSRSALIIPF
jgi:hypothetical protein